MSKKITENILEERVANDVFAINKNLTKKEVRNIVHIILRIYLKNVKDSILTGLPVQITGLVKFEVVKSPKYQKRKSALTGEIFNPSKYRLHTVTSKHFRYEIKNNCKF